MRLYLFCLCYLNVIFDNTYIYIYIYMHVMFNNSGGGGGTSCGVGGELGDTHSIIHSRCSCSGR